MSETPDTGMAAESKELSKDKAEEMECPQKPSSAVGTIDILLKIAKKMFFVGAIYFVGWMNWSVAWFICPVIVSAIRDQWKIESDIKRNIAKSSALHNEKDMILARIDELPAWVFFPDVERCEWLNKIFKQLWPNANQFTKAMLKDTLEPNLRKALSAYKLNGFQFDRIVLGTIPIRIGGIKVYEKNIARNEIILDMDIFYAGDCDINFSIGAMRAGIKDFQIHGMVRVVLKPLISDMPLVGGLQVFFLNNPNIDFNLVGVADFLDFPGISDLLRRIIVEQIAAIMVLPNKLPFILNDKVPAYKLKMPQPEGVLRIHVVEAKDLMKKDISVLGKGKSDPYCIITVGAQQFKTQTIMNNVNPKWDYWCEAEIYSQLVGQEMKFQLYDFDGFTGYENDDYLGKATIEISTVARKGELDTWLTLEEAKHGMVHLRLTWLSLTSDKSYLKAALEETQMLRVSSNLNSAVLNMYLDCVKNLPLARAASNPDPYVVLSVGKSTQQTTTVMRDNSPVFEQGFTFLVANPENDVLNIKVIDSKTGNSLGQLNFLLSVLLEKSNLETIQSQPFALQKSGAESKIFMSMSLRILKKFDTGNSSENSAPVSNASTADVHKETLSRTSSVKASSPLLEHQDSRMSVSSGISEQMSVQEEPFVMTTVNPALSMPAPRSPSLGGLIHRTPSVTSSSGQFNLGRIQMTIRYSIQRQKLVIIIHKIMHIPLKDPANIPDPYVKLYLLPSRSKDSKRKTRVVKDNCNPVFDETFEYVISTAELNNTELEVTVCTQKGFLSGGSPTIGMVKVLLSDPEINQQGLSKWFDLHPESRLE